LDETAQEKAEAEALEDREARIKAIYQAEVAVKAYV